MKKIYVAALGVMVATASVPVAYGQTQSYGDFDITISPRIWFRTDNSAGIANRFGNPILVTPSIVPGEFVSTVAAPKALNYPMYGLSMTVSPHNFSVLGRPTDFVLTALGGFGQTDVFRSTTAGAGACLAFTAAGTCVSGLAFDNRDQANRIDVEALARTSLTQSALFVYGLRYIRQYDSFTNFDESVGLPSAFLLKNGQVSNVLNTGFDTGLAEAGVQFSVPISASGDHRLVAGLTFGLGATWANCTGCTQSTFGTGLLDTSIGYQYSFNPAMSFLVRYRFEALAYMAGGSLLDQNLQVVHGPEVGFSYTF